LFDSTTFMRDLEHLYFGLAKQHLPLSGLPIAPPPR
jgi:hypothetical protein